MGVLNLTGCVKDDTNLPQCENDCSVVKGYFLTDNGKNPIAGVALELDWSISSELGGSMRKIAKSKTDENGFYLFQFYAKDNELTNGRFSVSYSNLDKSFLTQIYPYFSFRILKRDTLIMHNCIIPKRAFVKIEFIGSVFSIDSNFVKCFYKSLNNDYLIGDWVDSRNETYKISETGGNQNTYFDIMRHKGSIMTEFYDSIFIKPNDTGIYKINK